MADLDAGDFHSGRDRVLDRRQHDVRAGHLLVEGVEEEGEGGGGGSSCCQHDLLPLLLLLGHPRSAAPFSHFLAVGSLQF